jgi:hypothetical protein
MNVEITRISVKITRMSGKITIRVCGKAASRNPLRIFQIMLR